MTTPAFLKDVRHTSRSRPGVSSDSGQGTEKSGLLEGSCKFATLERIGIKKESRAVRALLGTAERLEDLLQTGTAVYVCDDRILSGRNNEKAESCGSG